MNKARPRARKYDIGEMKRDKVAQLGLWDHEKVGFGKFERELLSTPSNIPNILSLHVKVRDKQKTTRPSQYGGEFEHFPDTFIPQNKSESSASPGVAQVDTTKLLKPLGASCRVRSAERGAMEKSKNSGSKLQMSTSLALSKGFGGTTLSQIMGIGDDEQLVKWLVSLGPESSMLDRRPEFAPGETTWETLKSMPLY
ncbi:hypothetical protein V491_00587 [Pseudogymnoascus sp. VKM F-3775]|nr:hypothetical protein V491_00587 [Pseudogymnoascus sp. VKM F-3775]